MSINLLLLLSIMLNVLFIEYHRTRRINIKFFFIFNCNPKIIRTMHLSNSCYRERIGKNALDYFLRFLLFVKNQLSIAFKRISGIVFGGFWILRILLLSWIYFNDSIIFLTHCERYDWINIKRTLFCFSSFFYLV